MEINNFKQIAKELKEEYVYKIKVCPSMLKKIKEFLKNTKWTAFNSTSLGGVHGNFDGKIKNGSFDIEGPDNQYQMKNAEELFKCNEFMEIVENNDIKEILTKYFGRKPILNKKCIDIFYTKNLSKKNKQIKKHIWHIDNIGPQTENPKYNFIKLFIPLCNVTEENGCTRIIKSDLFINKEPLINFKNKRFSDNLIYKNYSKNLEIKMESILGEIFLARTDSFHKGGYCKSGNRLMIIVQYEVF